MQIICKLSMTNSASEIEIVSGSHFLAHQIRISDILLWDRQSYLTHAILPRLSCGGCTFVVLELRHIGRQCSVHKYFPDITRHSVWCSHEFYQTK